MHAQPNGLIWPAQPLVRAGGFRPTRAQQQVPALAPATRENQISSRNISTQKYFNSEIYSLKAEVNRKYL